MPDVAKKGITVKVAAELHAEVSEYIRSHGMTMSEFVAVALDNESVQRIITTVRLRRTYTLITQVHLS